MKRIALIQEEIAKEQFKELCRFMNTIFQIIIVCPNKRVPEIPCMFSENIVCYVKAKGAQIFDKKYGGCSRVALGKYMDLPQSRNKRYFR